MADEVTGDDVLAAEDKVASKLKVETTDEDTMVEKADVMWERCVSRGGAQ